MLINMLALLTAGVWLFGFIGLAQILFGALTGKQPVDTQRSDLWPVVAVCFGVGVVMLIILGVLGFFTADHVVAPNPLPPVKGK